MEMYERKFNGESSEQISAWLEDSHDLKVSPRQLWRIFKSTIPDFVMEASKQRRLVLSEDDKTLEQIQELEKVAEMQMDRIKSQRWDEMDQEGIGRTNPQTGEIEYSATNKNLNDSIRTYNSLIKNILEMKATIGLVRKQAETIEIKTSMNTPTRQALTSMIQNALKTGPGLTKFIQDSETIDAEFTEHKEGIDEQAMEEPLERTEKSDVSNS